MHKQLLHTCLCSRIRAATSLIVFFASCDWSDALAFAGLCPNCSCKTAAPGRHFSDAPAIMRATSFCAHCALQHFAFKSVHAVAETLFRAQCSCPCPIVGCVRKQKTPNVNMYLPNVFCLARDLRAPTDNTSLICFLPFAVVGSDWCRAARAGLGVSILRVALRDLRRNSIFDCRAITSCCGFDCACSERHIARPGHIHATPLARLHSCAWQSAFMGDMRRSLVDAGLSVHTSLLARPHLCAWQSAFMRDMRRGPVDAGVSVHTSNGRGDECVVGDVLTSHVAWVKQMMGVDDATVTTTWGPMRESTCLSACVCQARGFDTPCLITPRLPYLCWDSHALVYSCCARCWKTSAARAGMQRQALAADSSVPKLSWHAAPQRPLECSRLPSMLLLP